MKLIAQVSVLLLFFIIAACCSQSNREKVEKLPEPVATEQSAAVTSVSVPVKELSGYFLKTSYVLKSEINLILAQNIDQLKTNFGVAKTMTNKIEPVNFDTDVVAGIALQPTDLTTKIKIEKVVKKAGVLNVHVSVDQGEKQSFSTTPLLLFSFPKDSEIKQVQLLVEEESRGLETL